MKKTVLTYIIILVFIGCKEDAKTLVKEVKETITETVVEPIDSIVEVEIKEPVKKSARQLKEELTARGFKTFDYVDKKTNDTILMQQYFMVFLKRGPIRGQNEEEAADLQKAHLAHLSKMYELGYADISGSFGDDGDIRGITIYNVPTLKLADSLAKSDPMVKAGRLEIEIHPWWAAKGFQLR
ncbi:hypothetical protein L3X37_02930 [Sabulilitoribacter arenilitoris]|uniref:YCII-related domain-containing protein n=1 Tax=Wocania arenilitoris TaxID=2044858 RepID=A0AAE3EL24_9FLAO|nr:YciI family protein [Wocania arenilitoris]MCF7567320.1 hypothetical protein [Wocania arenilitoris]